MNLRSLGAGLTFRGKVKGQIQTYHVFGGEKFFFICSFSRKKRKAGNFNIVDAEAVRYVQRLVGGKQGVTLPAPHRYSTAMFRPSIQSRSRRAWRKASSGALGPARKLKLPIR